MCFCYTIPFFATTALHVSKESYLEVPYPHIWISLCCLAVTLAAFSMSSSGRQLFWFYSFWLTPLSATTPIPFLSQDDVQIAVTSLTVIPSSLQLLSSHTLSSFVYEYSICCCCLAGVVSLRCHISYAWRSCSSASSRTDAVVLVITAKPHPTPLVSYSSNRIFCTTMISSFIWGISFGSIRSLANPQL